MDFEERTENRLNDHAARIKTLELKDAADTVRIDNLCAQLKDLADEIKQLIEFIKAAAWKLAGGMGFLLLTFLGFFIWYIQSLPR